MASISITHMAQLNRNRESARQALQRSSEQERQRNETLFAKQIQEQTGCTWSEAIAAVINQGAGHE